MFHTWSFSHSGLPKDEVLLLPALAQTCGKVGVVSVNGRDSFTAVNVGKGRKCERRLRYVQGLFFS